MRIDTNVANMRERPEPEARRSSQLLFNMKVEVLDRNKKWFRVRGQDNYSGWIRETYLNDFELSGEAVVVTSNTAEVLNASGQVVDRFSFGTELAGTFKGRYLLFQNSSGSSLKIERQNVRRISTEPRKKLVEKTCSFIGIPYLWGGTSAFGFDCSGFVQRIYGYYNISLPRDSDQQEEVCESLGIDELSSDLSTLEPSDLLFFQGHVGIYIGSGRMIHSSRRENGVAVTNLTSNSSYVQELRDIFRSTGRTGTAPGLDSSK